MAKEQKSSKDGKEKNDLKNKNKNTNKTITTKDGMPQPQQQQQQHQASLSETFSFVIGCGSGTTTLLIIGIIGGMGTGLVFPAMGVVFSNGMSDLSGVTENENGLEYVRDVAIQFIYVGIFALIMATTQTSCLEIVAHRACEKLRIAWFRALLQQDCAFFDIHNVAGIATSIGPSSNAYRRGVGNKIGELAQHITTLIAGFGTALVASWRVALLVTAAIPFVALSTKTVVKLSETKSLRAAESYEVAGSIAYSTVSNIRTVLSLNAIPRMIEKYNQATEDGLKSATSVLLRAGFASGSILGSLLFMFVLLTLYGSRLLYMDTRDTGCDPSSSVHGNVSCDSTGADVLGAMLGVLFAAQGLAQISGILEAIGEARVATYKALEAINRKTGAASKTFYHSTESSSFHQLIPCNSGSTSGIEEAPTGESTDMSPRSLQNVASMNLSGDDEGNYVETRFDSPKNKKKTSSSSSQRGGGGGGGSARAILPEYRINSMSSIGLKPKKVQGHLTFDNVSFSYPTRPDSTVLTNFSVDIEAGKTIAFVGPSGGGKSTLVKMIERFYDPTAGAVKLDGMDIKDINVKHLRSMIGYVGQEPSLFATTIAQNIKCGNGYATQEDIESAAKLANAHDFIMSFPDGYQTQVGNKGAQLSGGQKQRIAIARVLVANPSILLLDEATSALDSESELVVQEALDFVVALQKRTTVIIAHRLSTIRSADIIAVVMGGSIVEKGSHEELMEAPTGYYRNLVNRPGDVTSQSIDNQSHDDDPDELAYAMPHGIGTKPSPSNIMFTTQTSKTNQTSKFELSQKPLLPVLMEFKDVTFSYPTRPNRLILKNFNLQIRRGETVALVGPSGGGKSTVVALIERFYDPIDGALSYGGSDVKSLNVKWYRDQIGFVGQEPALFNETIASNIAYGAPGASQEEIEDAARLANAHSFITSFPEGFNTMVGERGTQLSGGQKQRIAIARAMVKEPEILILDEATSALDSESEKVVQDALDTLMQNEHNTCVVIAHRLSTIRNADRIAFIADGEVKEIGTHSELLELENGRYKRLVGAQHRDSTMSTLGEEDESTNNDNDEDDDDDKEVAIPERVEANKTRQDKKVFKKRARRMASPDSKFLTIGCVGSIFAGSVWPLWGVLIAKTIELLFRRVEVCNEFSIPEGFDSCADYWWDNGRNMQYDSYDLAGFWAAVAIFFVVGNTMSVWGFGHASAHLSKRVRDAVFKTLVRQEVAFFDKRNVDSIASQLQEDAARIHAFTGEPIRAALTALASVCFGIALSFVYMWPFACLALAGVPVLTFAAKMELLRAKGQDTGIDEDDELDSPGGIVMETLMNMGTVSSLTLEQDRLEAYQAALHSANPKYVKDSIVSGLINGSSLLMQRWTNGLLLWWGGYILYNYSHLYAFQDFLIANFALVFSLFGLGMAQTGLSDRQEAMNSASRIFFLLDRQTAIDPLGDKAAKEGIGRIFMLLDRASSIDPLSEDGVSLPGSSLFESLFDSESECDESLASRFDYASDDESIELSSVIRAIGSYPSHFQQEPPRMITDQNPVMRSTNLYTSNLENRHDSSLGPGTLSRSSSATSLYGAESVTESIFGAAEGDLKPDYHDFPSTIGNGTSNAKSRYDVDSIL